MTLRITLAVLVTLGVLDAQTEASKNLLPNPSFERLDADGNPVGWRRQTWGGRPKHSVERRFAHSGETCVRVDSTEGADASWATNVRVEPHTRYRLSLWIKTENLDKGTGRGAQANFHELQHQGRTRAIHGTNDWTLIAGEFDSGPHTRLLLNVLLGGWGHSKGTAWFDDVSVTDATPPAPELDDEQKAEYFADEVRPVLERNCFDCHGPESELKGGLYLGSRDGVMAGGDSGPAVSVGNARRSLLIRAVHYEGYEMPPSGRLSKEDVTTLTTWVRLGVPWSGAAPPRPASKAHVRSPLLNDETRAHWAFRPITRPVLPATDAPVENPVDAFVQAKLEELGIPPSPEASKERLLRRATYDLTGLPPTPQEVAAFVADDRPDAYERLLDRLLASPHYGEKWGRHWLDLVRYAESNSFERDGRKPHVWRYRDYVIESLNEDKPFDRFAVEQLAGDELPERTGETLIATGFYRLGQWDDEPADKEQALYDDLDDILTTTSQAFLGLTINCARCHDHKLDPIPQEDYYRMLAFFRNVRRYGVRSHDSVKDASVRPLASPEVGDRYREDVKKHQADTRRVNGGLREIEKKVKPTFTPLDHEEFKYEQNRVSLVRARVGGVIDEKTAAKYERLTRQRDALRQNRPAALGEALCVTEWGPEPKVTRVLGRGNPHVPGKGVRPGIPQVLPQPAFDVRPPAHRRSTGRRLALARWIVSPQNPLTARVIANRLWQHHFGRGIVASPNDFGLKGSPPTHPELLDWLASELRDGGWTLKRMHRLLMTSRAYRRASHAPAAVVAKDQPNAWLARFPSRRLTAEEVRDSVLAVSGRLNRKMFGPSIYSAIPREVLAGQSRPGEGWGKSPLEERSRRSVYIHVKRSLITPLLAAFDFADTDFTCPVRFQTVQPTQALTMLNSELLNEHSRAFAEDLMRTEETARARVTLALRRVTQREPKRHEVRRGEEFLRGLRKEEGLSERRSLELFCLLMLNLSEFVSLD